MCSQSLPTEDGCLHELCSSGNYPQSSQKICKCSPDLNSQSCECKAGLNHFTTEICHAHQASYNLTRLKYSVLLDKRFRRGVHQRPVILFQVPSLVLEVKNMTFEAEMSTETPPPPNPGLIPPLNIFTAVFHNSQHFTHQSGFTTYKNFLWVTYVCRMVMSSRQLKSLDLRGSEHFSVQTLLKLPCPDLEKLMMGIRVIDDPRGLVELLKQVGQSCPESYKVVSIYLQIKIYFL